MKSNPQDFPCLSVSEHQPNQQENTKGTRQNHSDKDYDVHIQGMNDFLGFYYEDNHTRSQVNQLKEQTVNQTHNKSDRHSAADMVYSKPNQYSSKRQTTQNEQQQVKQQYERVNKPAYSLQVQHKSDSQSFKTHPNQTNNNSHNRTTNNQRQTLNATGQNLSQSTNTAVEYSRLLKKDVDEYADDDNQNTHSYSFQEKNGKLLNKTESALRHVEKESNQSQDLYKKDRQSNSNIEKSFQNNQNASSQLYFIEKINSLPQNTQINHQQQLTQPSSLTLQQSKEQMQKQAQPSQKKAEYVEKNEGKGQKSVFYEKKKLNSSEVASESKKLDNQMATNIHKTEIFVQKNRQTDTNKTHVVSYQRKDKGEHHPQQQQQPQQQQPQQYKKEKEEEEEERKRGLQMKGKTMKLKGKTSRQKESEQKEISNEWNSDAKQYVNENQTFYLNEDKAYHFTNNKFTGQRRGNQLKILMVAEKPSIAKTLADALSSGSSRSVKGYSKYLPVHEFEDTYKGVKALFRITSVAGHVYGLDFTIENQNWNKVNPVNLFSAKTVKVDSNPSSGVVKHLESEAQDCSYLLLWLDNDREGENICFEVKNICERLMCFEGKDTNQVLRAKFSSLTKQDLVQAYKNTRDPPNINESKAVDARQIIDLKVGSAFTRYQTLFFRNKYPELNQNIISFGPCQTPTLGFCVEREDEIKNFKPRLYYRLRVTYFTLDKKEISSYYEKGHIFNQADANKIYQEIATQTHVTIESVVSDTGVKQRPEGLNTVQLLKVGSSYLQMSPIETMHVAERLYLAGYITYPRTESTAYPKTFDFDSVLSSLQSDVDYGQFSSDLIKNRYVKPRQGIDMGDHPPITPTANYPSQLKGEESKLYDYIARHFIGSLSEDCKYKKISITSTLQGYHFVAKGIQMVKKGFLEVMDSVTLGENTISSNLHKDDKLLIGNTTLEQEYTSPPGFITESELLSLMEKHSIGTDASMATHIQNICNRQYVMINGSNRSLVPTELGRSLIHGYQKIDPDLVQPQIRAKIENLVGEIAKGNKQFCDVIDESLKIFQSKFLKFVENISKMDFLFGSFCSNLTLQIQMSLLCVKQATFDDTLDAAKPFSKCGKCKRFMKIIEKAGKIICEKCDITLSIPTNGKFKLAGEKFCPYDHYQVIFFTSAHTPNVSFEICPKCYTESPLIDSDQVTCSICTNDLCKLSINSRYLKECSTCQVGDIVLEPVVAQKLAAMCNECWTQWCLPIQTKDLTVNKEKKCEKCLSQLISFKHVVQAVKVHANKTENVHQDRESKDKMLKIVRFSKEEFIDVCLFCDEELQKECHRVEYSEPRRRRFQKRNKRQ